MNRAELISELRRIKTFAETSKANRFLHNPIRYLISIIYSRVLPLLGDFIFKTSVKTFWGQNIHIVLPASIDIYLSGGKTHDSEIRLARFLVNELKNDSCFLDIGAHYGYFTMLASHLLEAGKVYSIEPSTKAYQVLETNCKDLGNVDLFHCALTDSDEKIEFYEFPTYYSEYNTLELEQYSNQKWYDKGKIVKHVIEGKKGDTLFQSLDVIPRVVKIDVEGAEYAVLKGLRSFISTNSPLIVMEFAASFRGNINHKKAHQLLQDWDYKPFYIDSSGEVNRIESDMDTYLNNIGLDSDNIVYKK